MISQSYCFNNTTTFYPSCSVLFGEHKQPFCEVLRQRVEIQKVAGLIFV